MADTPIIGVVGWKNTGKTRLVVRLVTVLTQRGLRVATVKHAHHLFDVDHPDTDSYRHRQAGARQVAIISEQRWAVVGERDRHAGPPHLGEALAKLSPSDIVVVEGFKAASHPKIELRRRQAGGRPLENVANIVALVTDDDPGADWQRPVFAVDDIEAIADFIVSMLRLEVRP